MKLDLDEVCRWLRRNTVWRWQDLQATRELKRNWYAGITYLDHGYEPCALVDEDGWGGLTGVSMVDGRVIGGCSVYHCGPERVSLKEANAVAAVIKKMQAGVKS
jgi:hypothetical protein